MRAFRIWIGLTLLGPLCLADAQEDLWNGLLKQTSVLRQRGRYAEAIMSAQKALATAEKTFGSDDLRVAGSLDSLVMLYTAQGQGSEAEPLCKRALAIREKHFGPEHPDVANTLSSLAEIYAIQEHYAEAKVMFRRALAIREKALGPESLDLAVSLDNLSKILLAEGQDKEANLFDERSRAIKKELGIRTTRGSRGYDIPEFPWPPPEPSASVEIKRDSLIGGTKSCDLGYVAGSLETAFEKAGYVQRRYYQVPGGFALVSQMEQFNDDGTSRDEPERFSVKYVPPKVFSLVTYLKALFFAKPGRYRIIVFVVSDKEIAPGAPVADTLARSWLFRGMLTLPRAISRIKFSDDHMCIALIYEYQRQTPDDEPIFNHPGYLDAKRHLILTHIWKGWER